MFWPYHDTLFLNQFGENIGTFSDQALAAYAEVLELDMEAFNACMDDNDLQQKLNADQSDGRELGAVSTPTIFLNGEQVSNNIAFDFGSFNQLIQAAIARAAPAEE